MSFRTILAFTGADQTDADIRQAVDLCRDLEAHLEVVVFAVAVPPPVGQYAALISEPWLQEREQQDKDMAARVTQLAETLRKTDVPFNITGEVAERAFLVHSAGRHARFCDLALVGPDLAASVDLKGPVLNGVLFEAERPVLLVPDHARVSLKPETVLVAWNSSPEALRAIRESLSLLTAADSVHVAMVDPEASENDPEPGADVAAWLVRHGVRVTVDRLPGMGKETDEILRQHAIDIDAELLVMGAYGHSRLRERIFGGVTRSMIDHASLPVLMAR